MEEEKLNVLFIGESARSFFHIAGRLERSGCRCRFAKSSEEAHRSLLNNQFALVVSAVPPRGNAISSIADALTGTRSTFFFALLVEKSCWWIPALRRGEPCIGEPALRPSEFSDVLDEVVAETHAARAIEGETASVVASPEQAFAAVPVRKMSG